MGRRMRDCSNADAGDVINYAKDYVPVRRAPAVGYGSRLQLCILARGSLITSMPMCKESNECDT